MLSHTKGQDRFLGNTRKPLRECSTDHLAYRHLVYRYCFALYAQADLIRAQKHRGSFQCFLHDHRASLLSFSWPAD